MATKVNGTTGVDKHQSGSVEQDDLASGVVGKGPCFRATGVAFTVQHGVSAKAVFGTEQIDTNNNYDPTLSRFTPNVAGYYSITANVQYIGTVVAGGLFSVVLTKNGSSIEEGCALPSDLTYIHTTVTVLVYLNGTGDYVEVIVNQSLSAPKDFFGGSFSGHLVRAA